MKLGKGIIAAAFAFALAFALTACGGAGGSASSSAARESASSESASVASDSASASASAASDQAAEASTDEMTRVLTGSGLTTAFVGSDVTDATVTNQEEAQAVIDSLIERMGGDGTTDLDLVTMIPTESGNSYYIFQQEADGVMVYGASAKLIVDKDSKVIGLVSAILPDVKLPSLNDTAVSKEQAEKIAVEALASFGVSGAKVASDYTLMTVVPLPNTKDRYCLAWVVYVPSSAGDNDDQGWIASYVATDGTFLYGVPVSEPNGGDALRGQSIGFDFDALDQQEKTFDITLAGESKQVTVPVLVDKESGKVAFMGDAKRKILCVDHTEASENDKLVSPFEKDGESFNDNDIAVYDNFIRIYDYYASMGWEGPDGLGAPSLLMMNCMQDGKPMMNCAYTGFDSGWETFAFGRAKEYGAATDIIAHEYTHCVTSTTMTTNLYANEPGAINEGMSDIMGNLIEMALDGDAGAWIIGENSTEGGDRSMSDPPTHYQPEYRWGAYYTLNAPTATTMNDQGGVHGNSSMLNIISYKLDKAGMSKEDQLYYWMNVALALVPTSDYPQMAELLPWVLEQSGYSQYKDALNQAIDEAGYTKLEQPAELPEGVGAVEFTYPDAEAAEQGQVRVVLYNDATLEKGTSDIWTWPAAPDALARALVPANDYFVTVLVGTDPSDLQRKVYTGEGWVEFDPANETIDKNGKPVHVEAGKTIELSSDGLA